MSRRFPVSTKTLAIAIVVVLTMILPVAAQTPASNRMRRRPRPKSGRCPALRMDSRTCRGIGRTLRISPNGNEPMASRKGGTPRRKQPLVARNAPQRKGMLSRPRPEPRPTCTMITLSSAWTGASLI